MVFGLFKKTDPICGMKEEKGKGTRKYGQWFCNESCMNEYEKKLEEFKKNQPRSCCH